VSKANVSPAPTVMPADSQCAPAGSETTADGTPTDRKDTGRIARLFRYATHDGPGIRMLVLLKGCPLRCPWCHNPEAQNHERELIHLEVKCAGCGLCTDACPLPEKSASHRAARPGCRLCGSCVEACPSGALQLVGEDLSAEAIVSVAQRDEPFYRASRGGVTISGGEPLAQPHFTEAILRQLGAQGIHTAIETCGFAPMETLVRLAEHVDLWLYDVKHVDSAKHLRYTGRSCAPILQNLSYLLGRNGDVIVRIPVIPGFNDTAGDMEQIATVLTQMGARRVELLPFNPSFVAKLQMLGRAVERQYPPTPQPPEEIDSLRRIVAAHIK